MRNQKLLGAEEQQSVLDLVLIFKENQRHEIKTLAENNC